MKVQPVSQCRKVRYPTRPALDQHPDTLQQLPSRWRANPVVIAALASLFTLSSANQQQATPKDKVAPLFVHGQGRGSFGCVVVNPPVFLSETEARAVILEEAKKAGIAFQSPKGKSRTISIELKDKATGKKLCTVDADGIDRKRKIAFVFVSQDDADHGNLLNGSSVYGYDLKQGAKALIAKMSKYQPETIVGTFYDPMMKRNRSLGKAEKVKDWKAYFKKVRERAKASDREELRKQVRDFVKWLKAQGVI
jgi:hypothetical protein